MFLTGSYAIELRNYGPFRDTSHSDIDFVGTRPELDGLIAYFQALPERVSIFDHEDRAIIIRLESERIYEPKMMDRRIHRTIGFLVMPDEYLAAMEAIPDHMNSEMFGQEIKIISAVTNAIMKRSLTSLTIARQKHTDDAQLLKANAYYDEAITPQHMGFFRICRKQMIVRDMQKNNAGSAPPLP